MKYYFYKPNLKYLNQKPEQTAPGNIDKQLRSTEYAIAKLSYLNNDPLPFVYQRIGELMQFTNCCDPKQYSRTIFAPYCNYLHTR
jgi:hypothetical protein